MEVNIGLLGASSVGKTSFISRLATDIFQSKIDYENFYYKLNEGPLYNFKLTDFTKAQYVILMFDLSNLQTLEFVNNFLEKENTAGKHIILIGNKKDLFSGEPCTFIQPLNDFVSKHLAKSVERYYSISALGFQNYTKPFDYIIEIINMQNYNIMDLEDL